MNKAILEGTLEREPVIKYKDDGTILVARFSIKTTHVHDNKEHYTYHRLILFGEQARGCDKMKVGGNVRAEGRIQTRKIAGEERKYVTEIVVEQLQYQPIND